MPARARFVTLIDLESARLGARFGMRAASVLGVMIAFGFAIALIAAGREGSALAPAVVTRALGWLSWVVAGSAALAAARELGARGADDAFAALAAQRGVPAATLGPARLLAAGLRIARAVAIPGLALAILAAGLADSAARLGAGLLLALEVLGYSVLLGATLAVLARWSAMLQPRRAGLLLAALVLVPELAREVWSGVPSLPHLFGVLLERFAARGALE
jgi:hypothetical protein